MVAYYGSHGRAFLLDETGTPMRLSWLEASRIAGEHEQHTGRLFWLVKVQNHTSGNTG